MAGPPVCRGFKKTCFLMKIPTRFQEDTIDGKTPILKTINNGLMVESLFLMPKTRGQTQGKPALAGPCETSLDRLVSRPARYRCGGLVVENLWRNPGKTIGTFLVGKLHIELLPEVIRSSVKPFSGWWFGTWMDYFPFQIWDIYGYIIRNPLTKSIICQDGRYTTNQLPSGNLT